MERKMKFRRAAVDSKGSFLSWHYLDFASIDNEDPCFGLRMVGFTDWQQFIGQQDKVGVDIYEGDIVSYTIRYKFLASIGTVDDCRLNKKTDDCEIKGDVIRFNAGSFEPIPRKYLCDEDPWYDWESHNFEVVGNIYENPELLSKEQ